MRENSRKYTILIVDDEIANLEKLQRTFISSYNLLIAKSGEKAFELAKKNPVDLVITDQKMPRMTGIELLKRIIKIKPDIMRIILTGYTEVEDLIDAINEGHVYRYITKPWDPKELKIIVKQALEKLELQRENKRLTEELKKANELLMMENRALKEDVKRFIDEQQIVYTSSAMDAILKSASKVADVDSTVLIMGETGTGKELLARYIHGQSPRANRAFVAVNCGAIPRELVESEFFGYKKGAFSGAATGKKGYFKIADGGTLFLDEIGEAPVELQVKLLRVLQNGEIWPVGAESSERVNVRIIASTNRDLQEEVKKGNFREDLFFRLNVFSLRIPPLRERKEDIVPLARFFLDYLQQKLNRRIKEIDESVLKVFQRYNWPGNVRQLENEIERLVLMSDKDGVIGVEDLPYYLNAQAEFEKASLTEGSYSGESKIDLKQNLGDFEKHLIKKALEATGGNKTRAAKMLCITRQSLLDKMKRRGMI